jgi:hypothetical protein
MKEIRQLCKRLNIEADYLTPLLNKYSLEIIKAKLKYIIAENIKRGKANEQLIENPYVYLKKLLNSKHATLNQNHPTNANDLNILPTEFLKLSNTHGNDFLNKKIIQTNKIAEIFDIKNKLELFYFLVNEDEGSNKYGIESLIKSSIESLQFTVNEAKETLASIVENALDTVDKRIVSFEENTNKYSEKLAESYRNSIDDANIKYIEQSKALFDNIKEQSLQTILPEMKDAISETIKANENYLESTVNIIKNKMEVSFKLAATCGLIFLLIGVFLGVYMAPLIEWISVKLNFDYGLLILFAGSIFPFVVGVLLTALIYKRLLKNSKC